MQSLQDLADRTCSGLAEMHEQLINNVSFNGDDGRYDPFAVYEREICRCEAMSMRFTAVKLKMYVYFMHPQMGSWAYYVSLSVFERQHWLVQPASQQPTTPCT